MNGRGHGAYRSNWKGTGTSDGWAKKSPMDCEERLATQACPEPNVSRSLHTVCCVSGYALKC